MNLMKACSSLILALTVAACGAPPAGGRADGTEHDDTVHAPTPKLLGKTAQDMCADCDKGDDTGGSESAGGGDDESGGDDEGQPIGEGDNGNSNDPDPPGTVCDDGICACATLEGCQTLIKQGKCNQMIPGGGGCILTTPPPKVLKFHF